MFPFFLPGLLEVSEPTALQRCLEDPLTELVNDTYFKGVPSLKPNTQSQLWHMLYAKQTTHRRSLEGKKGVAK